MESFGVIIIGSGARGRILAHSVAEIGKEIFIVEQGDFFLRKRKSLTLFYLHRG